VNVPGKGRTLARTHRKGSEGPLRSFPDSDARLQSLPLGWSSLVGTNPKSG
jgi:hypothetical protein